jgi:hypothetical protein
VNKLQTTKDRRKITIVADNSKMDNPKKLATSGTQDEDKQNKKTQHNM